MHDLSSTIVAVSTPPGVGGIAVIRLSGPDAVSIADKIWNGKKLSSVKSHTVHLGTIKDTKGQELDQAVATVFIAPASFTGQNTVEFAVHGSTYVQRELVQALIFAGAKVAEPGEFTRRAFLSGKMELTRAEAVADIIAADSRAAHRLAMSQLGGAFSNRLKDLRAKLLNLVTLMELELDFAEEEVNFADRSDLRLRIVEIREHIYRLLSTFAAGTAIKQGVKVVLAGPTNAGKSSLLNAIVGSDRAIVSDIHGTTRDTIEDTAYIGDYLFRFIDTAGLRDTSDPIEQMGIERSRTAVREANIVVSVIDGTDINPGLESLDIVNDLICETQQHIIVVNKSDISANTADIPGAIILSAVSLHGLDKLKTVLCDYIKRQDSAADIIITNQRHAEALQRALDACDKMLGALDAGYPTDLVARDGREVIDALAELTGEITSTEILTTIFSRFCIGK